MLVRHVPCYSAWVMVGLRSVNAWPPGFSFPRLAPRRVHLQGSKSSGATGAYSIMRLTVNHQGSNPLGIPEYAQHCLTHDMWLRLTLADTTVAHASMTEILAF